MTVFQRNIAIKATAPAVSIELREDRTDRWYRFRDRGHLLISDTMARFIASPTAPKNQLRARATRRSLAGEIFKPALLRQPRLMCPVLRRFVVIGERFEAVLEEP